MGQLFWESDVHKNKDTKRVAWFRLVAPRFEHASGGSEGCWIVDGTTARFVAARMPGREADFTPP